MRSAYRTTVCYYCPMHPVSRTDTDVSPLVHAEEASHIDLMRVLFVIAAVLMILPLPWFPHFLEPLTPILVIFFSGALILSAALFEERGPWKIALADVVFSFLGFSLAAYAATRLADDTPTTLTLLRLALTIVFAFALYTSGRALVRAVRSAVRARREERERLALAGEQEVPSLAEEMSEPYNEGARVS